MGSIVQRKKGAFYISANEERDYFLASADLSNFFNSKKTLEIISLRKNDSFVTTQIKNTNFIGCFNNQNTSIGTDLIPFLEHDDANRALMGSNMQDRLFR